MIVQTADRNEVCPSDKKGVIRYRFIRPLSTVDLFYYTDSGK